MSLTFTFGGNAPVDYDLAIVGGGPAGATAAMYAARANLRTIVLDKASSAGALAITSKIANYPGVPETLTGAELLERMRNQAVSFGAEFVQAQVMSADLAGDEKTLVSSAGAYVAKTVILATGKMGRKNKVPGEDEYLGRGVSYCATCDAAFFQDRRVAVFGSSEHALEETTFITQFANKVDLYVPGEKLIAPDHAISAVLDHPRVEVAYRRPLRAIVGNGVVKEVLVGGADGELSAPADGVFIFLPGNAPILDFAEGDVELTSAGCVAVGPDRMTSIPGVFAVGDLLCSFVQQAVVAAADGAIAAMAAEKYVRGRKKARSDWG